MKVIFAGLLFLIPGSLVTLIVYRIFKTWIRVRQSRKELKKGDFYLILAQFLNVDGEPTEELLTRCRTALIKWRDHRREIFSFGGKTKGSPMSQAKATKHALVKLGVPRRFIVTIDDLNWGNPGHDTLEEVSLAETYMDVYEWKKKYKTPIVVSNFLHLVQAHMAFERRGIRPILVPSRLRIWNPMYIIQRMVMILFTELDPTGRSFNWLRRGRAETWGSAI